MTPDSDIRPSDREMAYQSYRAYCAGIGMEPLPQHEYEIETVAKSFRVISSVGDA